MLQLMYQAALLAANLIDPATKEGVLQSIDTDLSMDAYQSWRIPATGTSRNWRWPAPDPIRESEANLEDVLSAAVSKLLHTRCEIKVDLGAASQDIMEETEEE